MGFTKRITQNKIGPSDGAPPLTVVEFSLTNDVRMKLEDELRPYIEGTTADSVELLHIIERNFPVPILNELHEAMGQHGGGQETVYIIRNMPEISREEMPGDLFTRHPSEINAWTGDHTYAGVIGRGLGLSLELQLRGAFALLRDPGQTKNVPGQGLHKHSEDVTMLGAIISDGAATRFTDMHALQERVRKDPELGKLPVKMQVDGRSGESFPLGQLEEYHGQWREPKELTLVNDGGHPRLETLIEEHSQAPVIGQGDMAVWTNHGCVFHQSLLTKGPKGQQRPSRVAVGSAFSRTK